MLFLDVNENDINNAGRLQEMIDNKKNVFILVYMIGCTPCKNTLPEWKKLKGCKELEQFKNNDDIIVANVEQSMCEKMHHKELENIMSFPTIKHIDYNDAQDYEDERTTTAFSKWIKSLVKRDGKLKDINHLVIKNQDKTNHGNIDFLAKQSNPRQRKPKTKKNKKIRRKSNPVRRRKSSKSKSKTRTKTNSMRKRKSSRTKTKTNSMRKRKSSRTKTRKYKNTSKARRTFQTPLSYTKSLPV